MKTTMTTAILMTTIGMSGASLSISAGADQIRAVTDQGQVMRPDLASVNKKLRSTESVNVTEGATNVGHATLIRSRNAAKFRVSTTNLNPDSAYTVWIAAFNDPGRCIDDCNGPDVPAADGSVFLGAAFVTDSGGTANLEFEVQAGTLPESLHVFAGHDVGIRRANGMDVELHIVFSDHGPSNLINDWASKLLTPGALPPEQVAFFIP